MHNNFLASTVKHFLVQVHAASGGDAEHGVADRQEQGLPPQLRPRATGGKAQRDT